MNKLDTTEFNGPAERAARIHNLMIDLQSTVSSMVAIYYEDDAMNDIQPPSFEKVIPMSLDEWALELTAAAADWQGVAAELQRTHDELREQSEGEARAHAEGLGFAIEGGGGGVPFLALYAPGDDPNRPHVYLTDGDGSGLPSLYSWCVGFYPAGWDGEEIQYDVRSGGALTFHQAIEGALALMNAEAGD